MKKIAFGFLFVLTLILVGCHQKEPLKNKEIDLEKASEKVIIPSFIDEDVFFPTEINYEGETIYLTYRSSDESVISNKGKVYRPTFEEGDVSVSVLLMLSYDGKTHSKTLNITVKALPEVTMPDVIFSVNFMVDDNFYQQIKVKENEKVSIPTTPTKDNHRFLGWFLDRTFETPFNFDDTITEDKMIYAKFTEKASGLYHEDFEAYHSLSELFMMYEVNGNEAFVLDNEHTQRLKLKELTSEATLNKSFDALHKGRFILVFDFIQPTGGASFTVELTANKSRLFSVGATRTNRFTYRNTDGKETSIPSNVHSVIPDVVHQVLVVVDTNLYTYKYFVKQNNTLIELTPQGGIKFMSEMAVDGIKIRSVGTTSPSTNNVAILDNLWIEESSELIELKSPNDPEDAIDWEAKINDVLEDITFYTYRLKHNISLPQVIDGATLSWTSSDSDILSNEGVVTRGTVDKMVTLTATARYLDYTATKSFEFMVLQETDDKTFMLTDYDVLGFAEGHVSIPYISLGDPGYYKVTNELEFLDAIKAENNTKLNTHSARIIEIASDLNLGYDEVIRKYPQVATDYRSVFQTHNKPSVHPTLIESGISKIYIQNRIGGKYSEGMVIFSKSNHTIKHATFSVKRSNNIIVRNLTFDELWEWDESQDYDSKDWDYFTIEEVNGIWFDHVTLNKAYDGLIDFKYGSPAVNNATFSFLKLEFKPNDFLRTQLEHFEDNGGSTKYKRLRDSGMSLDDVLKLISFQKKGFLLGGSAFKNNITELTIANAYVVNLQDRFPRLRGDVGGLGGDVHIFNNYYDASEVADMKMDATTKWGGILNTSDFSNMLVNQAIVTTENGAILAENNYFKGVTQIIKSNQTRPGDVSYTGKFLVLNSAHDLYGRLFIGSSLDVNTPFKPSNSDPVLPFSFNKFETLPYTYDDKLIEPLNIKAYLEETFKSENMNLINWLKTNQ